MDHAATKVSRAEGLIAKLKYFMPMHTLLTIYQSIYINLNNINTLLNK